MSIRALSTRDWLSLAAWLFVCLGVGALGAWATTPEIETWYRQLQKPTWTPPDWLFGPVWTALYVAMAVSAWCVQLKGGWRQQQLSLPVFAIQLALNLAWSWIFFAMHRPGSALVEIVVLWLAIAVTIGLFSRASRLAAALMIPYLAWVTFATALNAAIWRLNS